MIVGVFYSCIIFSLKIIIGNRAWPVRSDVVLDGGGLGERAVVEDGGSRARRDVVARAADLGDDRGDEDDVIVAHQLVEHPRDGETLTEGAPLGVLTADAHDATLGLGAVDAVVPDLDAVIHAGSHAGALGADPDDEVGVGPLPRVDHEAPFVGEHVRLAVDLLVAASAARLHRASSPLSLCSLSGASLFALRPYLM